MPSEKKTVNQVDVEPVSAEYCIEVLTKRGYETSQIYSYACAARSWHKKDSAEWLTWKQVEALTSVSGSAR